MSSLATPTVGVITPVSHIQGLLERLTSFSNVMLLEDISAGEFEETAPYLHGIFTNPNRASFFLGEETLSTAEELMVVCTASTGTVHIDLNYLASRNIEALSLKAELSTLREISSTAEHALGLLLAIARNTFGAASSVKNGAWDYLPFIGRELREEKCGIVGMGRLGKMFAERVEPLVEEVLFFDPHVEEGDSPTATKIEKLEELFESCSIVSLHVHPSPETRRMIGERVLRSASERLLLVNTARGEVVDEEALVDFLRRNPDSRAGIDVITDESNNRSDSPLLNYSQFSDQVLITPHIGGMTTEAQHLAFHRATTMLESFFTENWQAGHPQRKFSSRG